MNEFFNISGKIKKEFPGGPHKMYLSFRYEEAEEKYYIEFFHTALTRYLDLKASKKKMISILLLKTLGEAQLGGTLQLPTLHEESLTIIIPSGLTTIGKSELKKVLPSLS